MNFDQIKCFLEVTATGNFGRAAENLNVAQSTVSMRIKTLEYDLGHPLFTRGRRGAELTTAGHQLRRYALNMYRLWQQARQEVALPAELGIVLGLGAQVSLWERLILHWIPWMRDQRPDVALRVEADYSASLMRQLSDGLIDIGVMYQPRQTPGLVIEELLVERLVLVSTVPIAETAKWPEGYVFVDWGDDFRATHGEASPRMEASAVSVGLGALGLQYILQNGGSGYFPMRVVRPLLLEERLFRVPKMPVVPRPAYVAYTATPVDEALLELALKGLKQIAAREREI